MGLERQKRRKSGEGRRTRLTRCEFKWREQQLIVDRRGIREDEKEKKRYQLTDGGDLL
jgi:hypothetical protein